MSMVDKPLKAQLEHLGVLADPMRRALYLFTLAQSEEVSRDRAARALRISRALAAFHLDKLVAAGLLEASYRRLSGRAGPGAGRPSKLYRRSPARIDVTLPARRYELAATLLARALDDAGPAAAPALDRAAEDWGRRLGLEVRARAGADAGPARLRRGLLDALRAAGFEPHLDAEGGIVLGNCPFDALRRETRAMICGMNLALCRGLVAGLQASWDARLEPRPGHCCVVFGRR